MTVDSDGIERLRVDEMEVGAISLVQNGAVPDSNGFLVVQMAGEEITVDPGDLAGICGAYVEVIQGAPELALQMAAIDALSVALRTAVAPEAVAQSGDLADQIAGWDTWQGFQEYVRENVHTPEEALSAIDELAALQKSELNVTQSATPPVEVDDKVVQALAAIEQSETALAQARVALGGSNKLSAENRTADQRSLAEMGDSDGDESTEDEGDEEDDGDTEDGAGASLSAAMNGDADTALATRDHLEATHQNIKRTNTVVPPAAGEAAHPRTTPLKKFMLGRAAGGTGPGSNAVEPTSVNQSDAILQEAAQILAEGETTEVTQTAGLWDGMIDPLNRAVTQGHVAQSSPANPIEDAPIVGNNQRVTELPDDPKVLQAALTKAAARIVELEAKNAAKTRPSSRQSDADAVPVAQSRPTGLWDNFIPS